MSKISTHIGVLEDLNGELELTEVKNRTFSDPDPNASAQPGVYWFRVTIQNFSQHPIAVDLVFASFVYEELIFHSLRTERKTVYRKWFAGEKPVLKPHFVIEAQPGLSFIYGRLVAKRPNFSFYLYDPTEYSHSLIIDYIIVTGMVGGILALAFYNLIFYFFARRYQWFLHYAFTLLGVGLYIIFWKRLIIGNYSGQADSVLVVVNSVACLSAILFLESFIPIRSISEPLGRWYRRSSALFPILGGLGLMLPLQAETFLLAQGIIALILVSFILGFGSWHKLENIVHCIVGGSPMLIAGFYEMLANLYFLSPLSYQSWIFPVSSIGMGILFSTTLGTRFRLQQQEVEDTRDNLAAKENQLEQANLRSQIVERQLKLARAVQESQLVFPESLDELETYSYYKSANDTGGDWFGSYFEESSNCFYVFMADVTGHGMAASLITGAVAGSAGSAYSSLADPGADLESDLITIARKINEAVYYAGAKSERSATMALVAINLNTGDTAYLNAGHLPIFVKRAENSGFLTIPGYILGTKTFKYTSVKFSCQPGDSIYLFTDGIVENRDKRGKRLNYRGLSNIIEKSRNLKSLDHALKALIEDYDEDFGLDDTAYMMLKWRGSKSKIKEAS